MAQRSCRRVEALGDDGAIAVAGRKDFVEILVGPPVAYTEAVGRVESEVVISSRYGEPLKPS